MLQKNATIALTVDSLGSEGEGVGHHDGIAVFVPQALPGERVRVKIIKTAKRYAVGKLEDVLAPSPDRVMPPCPVYTRCGGCAAQHMAYDATLRMKRQRVVDCLQRIGHLDGVPVHTVWGMEDPWHYRNKGSFPIGGTVQQPQIGFYAPRSHAIVDAPCGCLLQRAESDVMVEVVRAWITRFGVVPYDEASHTGVLRHIVTRVTQAGDAMAALVINGDTVPSGRELVAALRRTVPGLVSVVVSENRERTNVIFGETCHTLWGQDTLSETLCGLHFQVSARAFFQVNPVQTERLYRAAVAYAALTPEDTVVDAYCGAGTITLLLAQQAGRAVGVEIAPEAVENARENAKVNGITNATFHMAAAEDWLPEMARRGERVDVLVVDPPRKGCDAALLDAAIQVRPKRIVYVSCDPATLARDAELLVAGGYRLREVQPVDMFCWSAGIECVAVFDRGSVVNIG